MAVLANLVVQITGNTLALNRALDKSESRISRFGNRAAGAAKAIGPPLLIAAGAATAFGVKSVSTFARVGDEIDKMSQRTGFSAERLSELRFAAEQSGADINVLEKGVKRMQAVMLDAEQGLKTATDSFDLLNISVEDLNGLNPEQQFDKFARAIAGVEDPSRRAALAQEVFGRAGTSLLPLFNQGVDGMRALSDEAHELGIIFDQEGAAAAARWTDSLNSLGKVFEGIMLIVGSFLVDALQPIIDETIEAVVAIKDWVNENEELVAVMSKVVQEVARALNPFTAIAKILPVITDGVNWVVDAINALIRQYQRLPDALQVFGEIEEVTWMAGDATESFKGKLIDAGDAADRTGAAYGNLADATRDYEAAQRMANSSVVEGTDALRDHLSYQARLQIIRDEQAASLQEEAAYYAEWANQIRAASTEADKLTESVIATTAATAAARRARSRGFVDATALQAPPSIYGGLDAIRRGLNVDFQTGAIDLDTHQALLSDAGRAFGLEEFAAGGIVRSPVLGLLGERASARPEVVAPLDRLDDYLGDRGPGVVYINVEIEQLRASDDDVEFVLERLQDAIIRGDIDLGEVVRA